MEEGAFELGLERRYMCSGREGSSRLWRLLASTLIRLMCSKLQSFAQASRSRSLDKESHFLWGRMEGRGLKNHACLSKTTICRVREKPCTIYRNKV